MLDGGDADDVGVPDHRAEHHQERQGQDCGDAADSVHGLLPWSNAPGLSRRLKQGLIEARDPQVFLGPVIVVGWKRVRLA